MSSAYREVADGLRANPRRWLVTGVAGFIGSNILELLLELDQHVVGLDDFSTGHQHNIDEALAAVGPQRAERFAMHDGDVRDLEACIRAVQGVNLVLHQAALGSVPKSIEDPVDSHARNVTGFVNVARAAHEAGVDRVVYASSSAVYGDSEALPAREGARGRLLSPYAATKLCDEVYAEALAMAYDMELVGLRYFNVFGRRQDPNGPYAAVIPRWIDTLLSGRPCVIFGDGETTRDFCHVRDVAVANVLAACVPAERLEPVVNIGGGQATSLNQLHGWIHTEVASRRPAVAALKVDYQDFRPGDIRHSVADIGRARRMGFSPAISVADGLAQTIDWYIATAERQTR